MKKKEVKGPAGVVLGKKEVYYTQQKENLGMDIALKAVIQNKEELPGSH